MTSALRPSLLALALLCTPQWAGQGKGHRTAAPARRELTEAACREWALQLEKTMSLGDATFFAKAFDTGDLAERVFSPYFPDGHLPPNLVPQMQGMLRTMGEKVGDELKAEGEYKLLAIRRSGEYPTALFRLVGQGEGFNYHEYLLKPDRQGKPVAVDLYIAMMGEWLSNTMARYTGNLVKAYKGRPGEMVALNAKMEAVMAAAKRGDRQQVLQGLAEFPPRLQKEKWFLMAKLRVLDPVRDADAYRDAVLTFQSTYPRDPATGLVSYNYYVARKDYDSALKAMANLKHIVGDDVHLDYHEGTILYLKGELVQALARIERATAFGTGRKAYYDLKLRLEVALRHHQETADTLTFLESRFNTTLPDLTTLKDFADFVKSPEYAAWVKAREAVQNGQ